MTILFYMLFLSVKYMHSTIVSDVCFMQDLWILIQADPSTSTLEKFATNLSLCTEIYSNRSVENQCFWFFHENCHEVLRSFHNNFFTSFMTLRFYIKIFLFTPNLKCLKNKNHQTIYGFRKKSFTVSQSNKKATYHLYEILFFK